MAFLEQQISPRITAETVFEVEHPSRLKLYDGVGALEGQVFGNAAPRHRVNLGLGVRTQADFQQLVDAFYIVMFTPYEGLRVKNWQDYQATATNSAVASLGGGTWQLQRKHTFGAVTLLRNITKPVNNGALQVFDAGGTPLTATVSYTAGTFTVVSGTPSYWTGEFDLPMTFADNNWTAKLEVSTQNLHLVNDPIMMEEVRG